LPAPREIGHSAPGVTHELRFAADVADHLMFMADGIVVEEGPPAQIFRAPTQERTKTFLQEVFK
jgi:ABC-type polar amino acid transport system ATPase subunit